MNTGQYISGAAHIGLIGWALVGGVFQPAPDPFEVTEVSVLSESEFNALLAGSEEPETVTDLASLPTPDPDTASSLPEPSVQDETVVRSDPVETTPPPSPEAPPEALDTPALPTEVSDQVAALVPPPDVPETQAPAAAIRPQQRPAVRVAPVPVAPPEPDQTIDDIVQDEVVDNAAGDEQRETQEKTVEEEAATEIVTEAEAPSSQAPSSVPRPRARPTGRRAAAPQTETAADTPQPANDTATETSETNAAVRDALAEALGQANDPSPVPSGPPMTFGEKDALRVSVQKCWNTGALSTEALRTIVVVRVKMNPDGKPDVNSVELVSSQGGSSGSINQAYRAARSAIIVCGGRGNFDLPADKYDQWREIEMTFNPEKMRNK